MAFHNIVRSLARVRLIIYSRLTRLARDFVIRATCALLIAFKRRGAAWRDAREKKGAGGGERLGASKHDELVQRENSLVERFNFYSFFFAIDFLAIACRSFFPCAGLMPPRILARPAADKYSGRLFLLLRRERERREGEEE